MHHTQDTLLTQNHRPLDENPLDLLPFVTQATFDASEKEDDPLCLPGTRVDLLQQIRAWADGNDEGYIFWLSGWAGTGKSTIARTVARECYDKGCLGASFFFSRGKEDVSHAGKFFTTIALQLAANFPNLGRLIREAASANHNIASKTQKEQWKLLIRGPLSKLEADSLQLPLVLVIDALDECEDDNDIKRILDLFFEAKAFETVRLRIFVTSRPEIPIRLKFHKFPGIFHQNLILHEIPQKTKDRDILVFFEHRFGAIRNESDDLSDDWPGRQCIDKLVSTAHGLFIYAATVCRFIENGIYDFPADDLLRLVLPEKNIASTSRQRSGNITTHESPTEELDMIYTHALEHSLRNARHEKDKEQLTGICRQVLGAVVILFDPLSPIALAKFLDIDDGIVRKRLDSLRAILDVPDKQECPIRLLHPSFRDFLLDGKRCRTQQFWVEEKKAHSTIVDCCVRLMSDQLRRDICRLNAAGTLTRDVQGDIINHCLPAELQYACLYWVRHLQKSETALSDNGFVYAFLCQHLLHWLEAMSLIRKTSEVVRAIISLESIVKVSTVLSP
jgi:NACHT domain